VWPTRKASEKGKQEHHHQDHQQQKGLSSGANFYRTFLNGFAYFATGNRALTRKVKLSKGLSTIKVTL
jgi:hypothetical protein